MLLFIIRHGAPDYASDSLLASGIAQAHAVAERLKSIGIDEIHASPQGRAQQTARPLANALKLPVITEPWARELGEESKTTYPDGTRKIIASLSPAHLMQPAFQDIPLDRCLDEVTPLQESGFPARYRQIADGLDDMLRKLGYARNANNLYDETECNDRRVALFCHAGMTRVMLSHLFHVPYQIFASSLLGHFTSITTVAFSQKKLCYEMADPAPTGYPQVAPALLSYGDVGHLYHGFAAPPRHYLLKTTF